jgi:hypothetical protein
MWLSRGEIPRLSKALKVTMESVPKLAQLAVMVPTLLVVFLQVTAAPAKMAASTVPSSLNLLRQPPAYMQQQQQSLSQHSKLVTVSLSRCCTTD